MPAPRTVDRLKRILAFVPWVIANPGVTIDEICARVGASRGDVLDDIQMLAYCGLPPFTPGDLIETSVVDDRVTISMADTLANPPALTRDEAVELLVAGQAAASLDGIVNVDLLRSALAKLARAIAPADASQTEDLVERVAVSLATEGAEMVGLLTRAIEARRRVRMTYESAGRGSVGERIVEPLLVFGAGSAWYLVGGDGPGGERKMFRADRIRQAVMMDDIFDRPEDFDASAYTDGPLFTPGDADFAVVIRATPRGAWLRDAVVADAVEEDEDGTITIRMRTRHLTWLVRLLLAAGPAARAVEPPALVEATREAARVALDAYS